MSCLHRHLSAIPDGRFACSDDLDCRSVFTLTTGREMLRAVNTTVELDSARAQIVSLTAQRDAARGAARICEQALAARGSRLDVEKWNPDV